MIVILVSLIFWCSLINATSECFDEVSSSPIKLLKPEDQVPVAEKNIAKQDEQSDKNTQEQKKGWFSSISSWFSNKTINNMNFAELKEVKEKLIQEGNNASAIKYLEKMMPLCNDLDELKRIMMELAKLYFEADDFEKAGKMFNEFTVLYPGCDEAEFALYQAILSNFKLTLDAEHDQTKTQETKELALAFLERESFTMYRKEVAGILNKCEERLFESDTMIFRCYLNIGNYSGQFANAKKHLAIIKESYLDKDVPDIAVRVAELEADLTAATTPLESTKTVVAQADESQQKPFKDRF